MFINRGNHEDDLVNKRYGFEKEVRRHRCFVLGGNAHMAQVGEKYGSAAPALLRAIRKVYAAMPLATVIDKKVLVLHAVCESLKQDMW